MDESERLIVVAALAPPERAAAAWRRWKASVPIAEATGMLTWAGGYMHRNLAAGGISEPYLAGIYRHNLLLNMSRLRAALPILTALTARWPITPLKSFGMGEDTHARGLRPLADIDVWLPYDQVHQAASLLGEGGFTPLLDVDAREFEHRILPQRGSWNHVHPSGVDIDLHWRLLDHLDAATGGELVAEHGALADSEFGTIRRLDGELMLCCLVAHFRSEGLLFSHGLFDVAHLMQRVDPSRVGALATRLAVARELLDTAATLRQLVGDGAPPAFAELERVLAPRAATQPVPAQVAPPQRGERIPPRYEEPAYLAHPRLYRFWTSRGRPAWLERMVQRWGGFTRTRRAVPRAAEKPRRFPTEVGVLGPGWHYLYPGDDYRWANLPDARVAFRGIPRSVSRVRIELSTAWAGTGASTIEVRANGRHIGVLERSLAVGEFALPWARRIELSLRPDGDRRWIGAGIAEQTYRLLAPVRRIELL